MLPCEFVQKYGLPVYRTFIRNAGETVLIQPDMDRYLLMFFGGLGDYDIFPTTNETTSTMIVSPAVTAAPMIFTFALHGSLVCTGWTALSGGAGAVLTVFEGFMRKCGTRARKEPKNASTTKIETVRHPSRYSVRGGASGKR